MMAILQRLFGSLIPNKASLPGVLEVQVPPVTEPFVARDKFVMGGEATVKIVFLGEEFKRWFLDKTEAPTRAASFRYITATSLGDLWRLAGKTVEATLGQIYALMACQGKGETGALAVNGCDNIFWAKDASGKSREVLVRWFRDGWGVSVSPDFPHSYYSGCREFSRIS